MPSRVPNYPDTGPRPPYSWRPQPQGVRPPGPSSSPPGTQPAQYYGYAVGPSGSYDSHHPSYPLPPPQRITEVNAGGSEQPQQQPVEERQGPAYGHDYSAYVNGHNPEAPVSQDRARASPPSRNNSYDQHQHDYSRPHPENTPYGLMHSRSTESAGSTEKTSPPKYPGDGRPPAPAYREAVPHSYVAGQHAPGRPPYSSAVHNQYGWTHPPYGSAPYPPPPPPRARRSLAPEYTPHTQYDGHLSRQGSNSTQDEKSLLNQSSAPTKARAMSPTQIESSRRDEVANMGCTCKKSKCLKLYCMCFGASVVCGPNCRCLVCFNTPDHEADRKEAVRAILSRNPAAFDTKFKKNADNKTPEAVGSDRVLSHKIGCKCRKSACTKKYCECFNAGIKCSATCRCIGCQNMPPGGFGPDPRFGYPMASQQPYPGMMPVRNNYVVEEHASVAAQNLAFMKHSSPTKPEGKPLGQGDPRGIASMPSLTSSDATGASETEASPQTLKSHDSKSGGGVANALLMAAYAMTELHTDESPTKPAANDDPPGHSLRSSPKRKSSDSGQTPGAETSYVAFESLPKPFPDVSSPQHGSCDATASPATSTESPLITPAEQRKSKRSRVGTHKKSILSNKDNPHDINGTPRQERCADSDDEPENKSPASSKSSEEGEEEVARTPSTRTRSSKSSPKDVLTPVSARCIDFRRMEMNGKKTATDSDGNDEGKAEQREIAA